MEKGEGTPRGPGEVLLDLLFPPRCALCGGLLEEERDLCPRCRESLPRCRGREGEQAGEFYSRCLSPLWYQDRVREGIHAFKFGGRTGRAAVFGRLMAQCLQERLTPPWPLVTWVPVSPRRRRERGYDQARLLAEALAGELGRSCHETLRKVRHNPAQSSLQGESARRANVLGSYAAVEPRRLAGRRFLLVDDVVTTGATLAECARVLRSAGAREVLCITLARAGRDRSGPPPDRGDGGKAFTLQ